MAMSEWIEHDGKSVPVSPETKVLIKSRDGYETKNPMAASWFDHADINLSDWRWPSMHEGNEIVSYRVTDTPTN